MKTRKLILVALFIAISLTSTVAQAGLFDWFSTNDMKIEKASNGSFDQMYASVFTNATNAKDEPIVMAHGVLGTATPKIAMQKTQRKTMYVQVSGYNSEVAQTDDSPFITASQTHVRWGVVAANMLPFGTVIKIPSLYGDQIFVVEDRMNTRYQNNVDLWFADKSEALKLGRRMVAIEVIR